MMRRMIFLLYLLSCLGVVEGDPRTPAHLGRVFPRPPLFVAMQDVNTRLGARSPKLVLGLRDGQVHDKLHIRAIAPLTDRRVGTMHHGLRRYGSNGYRDIVQVAAAVIEKLQGNGDVYAVAVGGWIGQAVKAGKVAAVFGGRYGRTYRQNCQRHYSSGKHRFTPL